jgi:proteasome lid subunit RPN8/RPN11
VEKLQLLPRIGCSLIDHAEQESPRECCGLLAGKEGIIEACFPLPNTAPQPERRYFAEPRALMKALRDIREAQQELLGIYHSHPSSPPEPSPTDIEQAYYPDCAYFIIGPPGSEPRLRAFRIGEDRDRIEPISFTWAE